ncbi:hypothetical protein LTS10_010470 [Elasticomyces elasticus]|nr:hypothetical protein LTS10_010470 [Elasticomyces elasticus]
MEEVWGGLREDNDFSSWHSKGSPLGGFPREGEHKAAVTLLEGDDWDLDEYGRTVAISRIEV